MDIEPRFGCDVTADLMGWNWYGPRPDLIWASPPCTEFSRERMPWCRTGVAPSLDLTRAAIRVIDAARPRFWVIENVRGAVPWFTPLMGRHRQSHGPFFLWGAFPVFECKVSPFKSRLSSARRAERAKVPAELSEALAVACESFLLNALSA
ncbi:MAG: DNA cytosine methyltransferase [Chloroflexota bacterium]